MLAAIEKRTIAIVTACLRADGTPTFARTEVEVTQDEAENGVHYFLVEAELRKSGYDEPMVHFADSESPAFLFPAVQQFLGLPSSPSEPHICALPEKPR